MPNTGFSGEDKYNFKVNEFKNKTLDSDNNKSILDEVLNYSNLKMLLSRKLKRVI